MKKNLFSACILPILFLMLFLPIVSAAFSKGNITANIQKTYAPSDTIKGWINISLQDESTNSLLTTNFGGSISIFELIKKNNLQSSVNCIPLSCQNKYEASGTGITEKSVSFSSTAEKKSLAFKINENITGITSLSFNVKSDSSAACTNQLQLDILADDEIDWQNTRTNYDFSCQRNYGCFNVNATQFDEVDIGTNPYCEKISLSYAPAIEIGAWVKKGTGNTTLNMLLYDGNNTMISFCEINLALYASESEMTCMINQSISAGNYFACIKAASQTDYKLRKKASATPCGFYGTPPQTYTTDYQIFARSAMFSPIDTKISTQTTAGLDTLPSKILSYINNNYANCVNGCVVPLKLISNVQQTVTISNVSFQYESITGVLTENKLYDTIESAAKINSNFILIELENAGFKAPSDYGNSTLSIYLNDNSIISQVITVSKVPVIERLLPTEVPAAYSTKFIVQAYSPGNLTLVEYVWNFGDGTTTTTINNTAIHTYNTIGNYTIKINVKDSIGQEASKSFEINVVSPKNAANQTLIEKRKNLENVTSKIKSFPSWYSSFIEKSLGIENIDDKLSDLEDDYEDAETTEEYIAIMANLTSLKVLKNIFTSEKGDVAFAVNKESISLEKLKSLGAGNYEEGKSENYKNAITEWFRENINSTMRYEALSAEFDTEEITAIGTITKLSIKPKKSLEDIYLIIDRPYDKDKIIFKEDYKEKEVNSMIGIEFSELDTETSVEFLIAEKIKLDDLLNVFYLSPKFSRLELAAEISPCNFNKICEKELEENWKNCRSDCKPIALTILFIFLILVGAFIIYVILQEWYKKHYEHKLFRDANELYNLISFMDNAKKQGISEIEIIRKLQEKAWKNEQIAYAMRKFKGLRTGMWEIPIFKWLEKKRVKREIEKRASQSQQGFAPSPFRVQTYQGTQQGQSQTSTSQSFGQKNQ